MPVGCPQRFRSIRCSFGSIMLGAPRPHNMHIHEDVSVSFCISGTAIKMQPEGELIKMASGSVIVFESYEPHAALPHDDDNTEVLTMLLDPDWVEQTLSLVDVDDRSFSAEPAATGQELRLDFEEIVRAMVADDDEILKDFEDLVTRVVAATFQLVGRPRRAGSQTTPCILDYRIRKALRYIDKTIADRMQLGEVAKHVGLSRSHFFEQFRRSVGVSPSAYANCHRMLIAAECLTCDSPTLAELSDLLGFSGPPQFSRFFAQQFGVSPSQFRLNVRSLDDAATRGKARPAATRLAS